MKPFDLDAAKRGEKVQLRNNYEEWIDVHFVGIDLSGYPVLQTHESICRAFEVSLRMAPKLRTMWIQCYVGNSGKVACTNPRESEYDAISAAMGCKLIDKPKSIQVLDES